MTVLKIADHRSHVTLSSREIAKLTAKDHKQVIHDIWEMFNDLYGLMKDSLIFTHMKNQIVTIIEGGEVSFDTRGHVSSFRLDNLTQCQKNADMQKGSVEFIKEEVTRGKAEK